MFELGLRQFAFAFVQGYNVSFLANGTTGSGKSYLMEGDRKDPGLILLTGDLIFSFLEKKKIDQESSGRVKSYNYSVRIRYCEIINEEVNDLLAFSYNNDVLKVVNNEWEGPTIANSTWLSTSNINEFNDFFLRGQGSRNRNVDEFGRLSTKATGYFVLELTQLSESSDSEKLVTVSKFTFFDLPGVELLDENEEAVVSRQGPTVNKSLFAYNRLVRQLASNQEDPVLYDTSMLTTLLRDALGGNSFTASVHCLQYGDTRGSDVNLQLLEALKQIRTYPTVNEGRTIGLLRILRREANKAFDNLQALIGDKVDGMSMKYMDVEKKLLEENLQRVNDANEKQALTQKLVQLRDRFNDLVKSKADLQGELIASEEEKLQISKSLVELQIENTKLMEIIQNEKYDANNKIVDQEAEILQLNVREEQAMEAVQELQDKLVSALEDKKELEIEFVAIKKNFLNTREMLENEKQKNENIRIELINTVNENKALQNEINQAYKTSSNATEDGAMLSTRLDNLQRKFHEQSEALVMSKAEVERLKLELMKYELKDQEYKLQIESKKQELERGFIEVAQQNSDQLRNLNTKAENDLLRAKEEKASFGSERMELMARNKQIGRKLQENEDEIIELKKELATLRSFNTNLKVQMDEKESIFRAKLMQYTIEEKGSKDRKMLGYEANSDLIRSYKDKETELMESLDRERTNLRNTRTELLALKNYAKQLRYLAEDWAPPGKPLPEILTMSAPTQLDNVRTNDLGRADKVMEEENERLRKRNMRLEEDLRRLNDQLLTDNGSIIQVKSNAYAKQQEYNDFSPGDEELRREKNELKMENEKLLRMMKESGQYDVYVLRKENERLQKTIKGFENSYGNASPISGDVRALSQKITFYEKTLRTLEADKCDLLSRATMAEENLKNLQDHLARQCTEYEKKIQELKRQLIN